MAVVVSRSQIVGGPSTLSKLKSAKVNARRSTSWRERNSEETYVHIADSSAHKEWVKKTLEDTRIGSSTNFEAGKHQVWLEKQRSKYQSEAHRNWLHEQKSSAQEVTDTANCHEDWLRDMQMPASLMDGGVHQKEMTIAAACHVQSLWRGRAARIQKVSIVNYLQSQQQAQSQAQSPQRSQHNLHASEPVDVPTVPAHAQPQSSLTLEAVAMVQEASPERRSRVSVQSGCLGRTSKGDKIQGSPTSPPTPTFSRNISSSEV